LSCDFGGGTHAGHTSEALKSRVKRPCVNGHGQRARRIRDSAAAHPGTVLATYQKRPTSTPVPGDEAMPTHVTALFADRHSVNAAVEQLVQAGFTRDAISVLMSETTHEREFGSSAERSGLRKTRPVGVFAGIVAALVKLLPIRNGVALRGAGPLAGAMSRFSEGERVPGLEGALTMAGGLSQHQANFISDGMRRGSLALCVTAADDRARLAAQLLELAGGAALQAA
jgi:hypothetical protein